MKLSSNLQLYLILALVQLGHTHEYIEPDINVWPHGWPAEGGSVTLHCDVKHSSGNWTFHWYSALPLRQRYIHGAWQYTATLLSDSSRGAGGSYTLSSVALNHTGYYMCRAEDGHNTAQYTDYSRPLLIWVTGFSPSASLIIKPNDTQHFAPLSMSCEVQGNSSGWRIRWLSKRQELLHCPDGWKEHPGPACRTTCLDTDDSGVYWCESNSGHRSNAVNITVIESGENIPSALRVSPHSWPAEGDLVTLNCEVADSSADWTYLWYKAFPYRKDSVNVLCPDKQYYVELLSDSNRGAGGSYTLNPASLGHTGRYVCRAVRGEPPYHTLYSNVVPVWVTGLSPSGSLVSSANSSQMFISENLTLRCEGQDNSSVWRLRWHTVRKLDYDCPFQDQLWTEWLGANARKVVGDGTTCKSYNLDWSDSGVYWCESESGQHSNAVNITVAEKPKPVLTVWPHSWPIEGDTVTLTCDIRHSSPGWTFLWYKAAPYRGYISFSWTLWRDYNVTLVSTSNSGATYLLSPASLAHTALYACRAKRHGSPTAFSNVVPVWVTGRSPPASLLLEPSGTLHFTKESLSMTCKVEDNSTGWRLRWHPENRNEFYCPSGWGRRGRAMLPCYTTWLTEDHSMVYWCESESGQHSNALNITIAERTMSYLTVSPNNWVSEGETVTLSCETDDAFKDWQFLWFRLIPYTKNVSHLTYGGRHFSVELLSDSSRGAGGFYTLSPSSLNHTGLYVCKGERGEPAYQTSYSRLHPVWVTGLSPPARLVGRPNNTVMFESQAFSLSCEAQDNATGWALRWFTERESDKESDCPAGWTSITRSTCSTNHLHTKDTGVYWCESEYGHHSNAVNITVKRKITPRLRASDEWSGEGDSVTLSCEVSDDSTIDWTYQWFRVTAHGGRSREQSLELISDSGRGAGGTYTLSSVALVHQGLYVCRAAGGEPLYHTEYSRVQPLWVQGLSPLASLAVLPNRRQHFYNGPLTLSCQESSNSTGWRLRWMTQKREESQCPKSWQIQGSACNTTLDWYDPGVYWCESASGQQSNAVSIAIGNKVIIDLPSHPIPEGEPLTLRCLYKTTPSNISANFYKDNSLIQTRLTGQMTIPAFSKPHEGYYKCENPQLGKSDSIWVGVKKNIPAVLRVSPHGWPSEGDLVTLKCRVNDSSTAWKFHWYKIVPYTGHTPVIKYNHRFYSVELLSDKSTEEEGSYTIGPVALSHTGFYVCRAEGAGPVHYTDFSEVEHVWVTGPSPLTSLVTSTNKSVLFESDSVSLSCVVLDNSTEWILRWTADSTEQESGCPEGWSLLPGPTCNSSDVKSSDSGIYWCETKSGLLSNAVNLTVKDNIKPVLSPDFIKKVEGDSVTLTCELEDPSTNWTFHWYTAKEWNHNWSIIELPSESSKGAVSSYTLASVTLNHTGLYVCRAEGGEPTHYTLYSDTSYLYVTDESYIDEDEDTDEGI